MKHRGTTITITPTFSSRQFIVSISGKAPQTSLYVSNSPQPEARARQERKRNRNTGRGVSERDMKSAAPEGTIIGSRPSRERRDTDTGEEMNHRVDAIRWYRKAAIRGHLLVQSLTNNLFSASRSSH